jgi:3'-phosphoadenosine 5'-phosphosulfate sulfotransferase (PAPS reductase)/FAD synthetase
MAAYDKKEERLNIINISGGKDSAAVLLLARERIADKEPMRAVFCDTGHEHPLTYEFVDYLSESVFPIEKISADLTHELATRIKNLEEGGSTRKKWMDEGIAEARVEEVLNNLKNYDLSGNAFLDLAVIRGRFPSVKGKFCTQVLKVFAIQDQVLRPALEKYEEVVSWIGERAEESADRAAKPVWEEQEGDLEGSVLYRPILDWKWNDVFEMHAKHGVTPNPLYTMGMSRVGCMPCIMNKKSGLEQIFKRWPSVLDNLQDMEEKVRSTSKKGLATFFATDTTPGDGLATAADVEEWSKTSRGGNQRSMRSTRPPLKCDSVYGLCE